MRRTAGNSSAVMRRALGAAGGRLDRRDAGPGGDLGGLTAADLNLERLIADELAGIVLPVPIEADCASLLRAQVERLDDIAAAVDEIDAKALRVLAERKLAGIEPARSGVAMSLLTSIALPIQLAASERRVPVSESEMPCSSLLPEFWFSSDVNVAICWTIWLLSIGVNGSWYCSWVVISFRKAGLIDRLHTCFLGGGGLRR